MSGFWERRRRAVEAEEAAEAAAREEAEAADAVEGLDDAEVIERLGLPDPDAIGPGDDVAAFMAKAVPAHIRNRALRRLWTSNPLLANLDGLADYAEDYTGNGLKGAVVATTYQVGRGLAAHVRKVAEEAEAASQDPLEQSDYVSTPIDAGDVKNLDPTAEVVTPSHGMPSYSDHAGQEEDVREEPPRRARMRFAFGEDDDERRDADGPGRLAGGSPPG